MSEDTIVHNGTVMSADWLEQIRDAQESPDFRIAGVTYPRIRYGGEAQDWGADRAACGDFKGQYHVPGCDVERCPRCGGQVITCGCPHDGD